MLALRGVCQNVSVGTETAQFTGGTVTAAQFEHPALIGDAGGNIFSILSSTDQAYLDLDGLEPNSRYELTAKALFTDPASPASQAQMAVLDSSFGSVGALTLTGTIPEKTITFDTTGDVTGWQLQLTSGGNQFSIGEIKLTKLENVEPIATEDPAGAEAWKLENIETKNAEILASNDWDGDSVVQTEINTWRDIELNHPDPARRAFATSVHETYSFLADVQLGVPGATMLATPAEFIAEMNRWIASEGPKPNPVTWPVWIANL